MAVSACGGGQPLDLAFRAGSDAFEGVRLPQDTFDTFVIERLGEGVRHGEPAISEEIAQDLFLACACVHRDATALSAFDERFLSQVPSFLARIDKSAAVVDEVTQRVRERLFVPKGDGKPRIGEYGGRGRLGSWLRVVVIRIALNMKTSPSGRRTESEDAADALLLEKDPELSYLRSRYRQEFHDAFVGALETLDARDRTILRMNLIDGLNIDGIGQMYGVHRATVARWIAKAREQLFERTRDTLVAELGLSSTEFASLVRLVRSQLDVSICRILSEKDEA